MRRVVIDTNVVVSSVISAKGNPAEIMNLCFFGSLQAFYTEKIFDEYKKVLSYERLNISPETRIGVLNAIEEVGILIEPAISDVPFPDESDRIFYDTAKSSGALLITGNIKHFPDEPFIIPPAKFLELIRKSGE